MESEEVNLTVEEKTDRIKTLLHELYTKDHQTFLEIQFESSNRVYQSYPSIHNVTGITSSQREDMQDIVNNHGLETTFEDFEGETGCVTARHPTEPTEIDHMKVLENIISQVYDASINDISLAFLNRSVPDSPEPLLWTDIEGETSSE